MIDSLYFTHSYFQNKVYEGLIEQTGNSPVGIQSEVSLTPKEKPKVETPQMKEIQNSEQTPNRYESLFKTNLLELIEFDNSEGALLLFTKTNKS